MRTVGKTFTFVAAALAFAATQACAPAPALAAIDIPAGVPDRALPEIKGEERAVLTVAPNVPAPITRDMPPR